MTTMTVALTYITVTVNALLAQLIWCAMSEAVVHHLQGEDLIPYPFVIYRSIDNFIATDITRANDTDVKDMSVD